MIPFREILAGLVCGAMMFGAVPVGFAAACATRLNGSFLQYQEEMHAWPAATWTAVLSRMKELRMDTVIVQMLVRENNDGTLHSFITPPGSADATDTLLQYADTNGFKVYLGLYLPNWNHDMTASNFLFEAQTRMAATAQQAWDRYLSGNRHASFAGWYLPYEPWTAAYSPAEVTRLRGFFQAVDAACRAVSGEMPLAMSPFISSARPPPCEVERLYTQLLDQSGIDLVLLQDSVGAQQWHSNIVQQVEPYARAFQRACAATGVRLWANLECFVITNSAYLPCDAARMQKQFEACAPFVERFVTFDFFHYMNATAYLSYWSQEHRARMQALFAGYKAFFVDNEFAPWGPPCVAARLAGNTLKLSWPGAPGDQFQAHYKTALTDTIWSPVAAAISTNGTVYSMADPIGLPPGARFYRVQRMSRLQVADSMAWVGPGSFRMGTPANDPAITPNELPTFTATLTQGYWMSRYEVTQSEYQNVMCTNPSSFAGNLFRPVERVSWNEAMDYCARLTEAERAAGRLPATHRYRLPTEAEWENAVRAGTTNWFSFGNDAALLGSYGWYNANSSSTPHPISQLQPNPWGLRDVHGNVFEWCWDWIGAAPAGPVTNLLGATNGAYHAIRGGAWSYPSANCRSSWRIGYAPGVRAADLGFRVVLAPVPP